MTKFTLPTLLSPPLRTILHRRYGENHPAPRLIKAAILEMAVGTMSTPATGSITITNEHMKALSRRASRGMTDLELAYLAIWNVVDRQLVAEHGSAISHSNEWREAAQRLVRVGKCLGLEVSVRMQHATIIAHAMQLDDEGE